MKRQNKNLYKYFQLNFVKKSRKQKIYKSRKDNFKNFFKKKKNINYNRYIKKNSASSCR